MLYTTTHWRSVCNGLTLLGLLCLCATTAAQEQIESGAGDSSVSYVTCDFDLPNLAELVHHLPPLCVQIYNDRVENFALYQQYEVEAQAFNRFIRKLNGHELPAGSEVATFDTELRNSIYNAADLPDCAPPNTNSTEEFLDCQRNRYDQLSNAVP